MLHTSLTCWSIPLAKTPLRGTPKQRRPHRATLVLAASTPTQHQVVLTREKGKNEELMHALDSRNISWLELPLIEAAFGPDRDQLPALLTQHTYDYVILTSPEAAAVFIAGWRDAGKPQVRIATVGAGTSRVLLEDPDAPLLTPVFEPTKANAVHLSAELPEIEGGCKEVLYPASVKAGSDLQNGLAARGFTCKRIHTYNTLPVDHVDASAMERACQASVVTFASPSAVKAWVKLSTDVCGSVPQMAVACIGSTSARAAEAQGLAPIYYPDDPGMAGFVDSIVEALGDAAVVGKDVAPVA